MQNVSSLVDCGCRSTMAAIYQQYKDEDMFLYMTYKDEDVVGAV
jgi:hypothetical protein